MNVDGPNLNTTDVNLSVGDEPITDHVQQTGVNRRTLLRWSAYMAGLLGLPAVPYAIKIANAATSTTRLPVLWLNAQDCTGDIESFLRAASPATPTDLLLNRISLEYSELLMAGAGAAANTALSNAITKYSGKYVVVVEGSVPTAQNGTFCTIGGEAFTKILSKAVASSLGVIAVGTCATSGGLASAAGGSTGASSVKTALGTTSKTLVNLPGCPVNMDNLAATIVNYLVLGKWPATDSSGRPTFAYGSSVHSKCERRKFYEAEKFATAFGDSGHQSGYCLKRLGCKGPGTRSNCPTVKFNSATSWPVGSGSICMSCTTSGFWDRLSIGSSGGDD
jgi:hydrogenase small subunit